MRERRKKQPSKRKSKGFVDAVYDGYIRHVALSKWREVQGMLAAGTPAQVVLREVGQFPERGCYRAIWEECWQAHLRGREEASPLVGAIEALVRDALEREREERKRTGDRPLDEEADFKGFVDGAFEQLFAEEAGSLEEFD
ncbi:MAG: hypothetical protein ACE5JN_08000 [Candidatus Methylomirabilia bacterium]